MIFTGYQGGWYGEADMVVCPPDEVDLQGLGMKHLHPFFK